MKPSETLTLLTAAITNRLPVLLAGAPGVGKSDLVALATAGCGAHLILSHPAVEDPTTPGGIPWPNAITGRADYLPCGALADLITATEPTVWCMDDLGQAPASVQAAYMQWILARRVNGMSLPDCVSIVACTNRRQDRAGVNGILEPVKSRFATIVEVEADIDDWCSWAIDAALPIPVIAMLRYRPDLLSDPKPTTDMTNSPSPRTWANLAKLVALNLPMAIRHAAYSGAVGEGAAVEFMAFETMFGSLVAVDDILLNPQTADIPIKPSELYAVSTALASRAAVGTIGRILIYAERMLSIGHGEFAVLTCRDCVRRDNAIKTTAEYIRASCGPIGKMILGEETT